MNKILQMGQNDNQCMQHVPIEAVSVMSEYPQDGR